MWGTGKINKQAPVAGAEFARTRVEGCEAGEVTVRHIGRYTAGQKGLLLPSEVGGV